MNKTAEVFNAESILEKHCPSMCNLYLDAQGRNFRDRVVKAMIEFAAPPPASEGDEQKELFYWASALTEFPEEKEHITVQYKTFEYDRIRYYNEGKSWFMKNVQCWLKKVPLATLPTREPEEKEKFAIRFSEWLMIQCDYKNHCVWEYQGEEYTQQELIEIFKRLTPLPSPPNQSPIK